MIGKVSERSFEEAIERALLRFGPDAYPRADGDVAEPEEPYGDMPPGGTASGGRRSTTRGSACCRGR